MLPGSGKMIGLWIHQKQQSGWDLSCGPDMALKARILKELPSWQLGVSWSLFQIDLSRQAVFGPNVKNVKWNDLEFFQKKFQQSVDTYPGIWKKTNADFKPLISYSEKFRKVTVHPVCQGTFLEGENEKGKTKCDLTFVWGNWLHTPPKYTYSVCEEMWRFTSISCLSVKGKIRHFLWCCPISVDGKSSQLKQLIPQCCYIACETWVLCCSSDTSTLI